MIGYTCPICGSLIEQRDTTLSMSDAFRDPYAVRIEHTIEHKQPFTEGCQELFRLFVEEQKDILKKLMERTSQDLHSL